MNLILLWRHNEPDGVSNHQPYDSIVYSGTDQGKHQSSASLAFVRVIHRRPVNSPHKWPVTRKMFPFDDVIMTWHHDMETLLTLLAPCYHKDQVRSTLMFSLMLAKQTTEQTVVMPLVWDTILLNVNFRASWKSKKWLRYQRPWINVD